MLRKKGVWIVLIVVLLAASGGAGYYYYKNVYLPALEPDEPTLKTAKVRRGDLVVAANGSGELLKGWACNMLWSLVLLGTICPTAEPRYLPKPSIRFGGRNRIAQSSY